MARALRRTANGEPFEFEIQTEPIDVTMMSRTDPSWQFTDRAGHLHRWHVGRKVATHYDPRLHYHVPNLKRIVDVPASDEYPAVIHYECKKCRDHVSPGYTSDTHRQFIPGMRRFIVNGEPVSVEEFVRRAKLAYPDMDFSKFS